MKYLLIIWLFTINCYADVEYENKELERLKKFIADDITNTKTVFTIAKIDKWRSEVISIVTYTDNDGNLKEKSYYYLKNGLAEQITSKNSNILSAVENLAQKFLVLTQEVSKIRNDEKDYILGGGYYFCRISTKKEPSKEGVFFARYTPKNPSIKKYLTHNKMYEQLMSFPRQLFKDISMGHDMKLHKRK